MSQQPRPILEGLRVLDVSTFIAAPAAASALGDFGAEVIKVETPDGGDPHRKLGGIASVPRSDVDFCWALTAHGKKSLAIDLKDAAGRAALDKLIATADVLITNFPPPVRERLKLRYADVKPVNPRLVYASLTGYGEQGPDRDQPGFDATAYFARTGMLDVARYRDAPPAFSLPAQGDQATAMAIFGAVMMALYHREKTGEGGEVTTSLLANGLWSNGILAQAALVGAIMQPRPPRTTPLNPVTNLYKTADDRWLQLTMVREDKLWEPFCRAVGRLDLFEDARFKDSTGRRGHSAELTAALDVVFAARPFSEWKRILGEAGVTFGVINRLADIVDDPQIAVSGALTPTDIPEQPRMVDSPIRASFSGKRRPTPPPALGEHSDAVLAAAGVDAATIADLRRRKALV